MMYNSKKLREQIAEHEARCQAILDTGELTDDLRAELDRIQGQGEEGEADFKAGELHKLRADLKRVEAIEKRTKELAKVNPGTKANVEQDDRKDEPNDADKAKAKTTPFVRCENLDVRQIYRHKALKAFAGKGGEKEAYLAGMFYAGALLKDDRALRWCRDHGLNMEFRAALGEDQNQLGGFLVPDEVERRVIDLRESRGVFRQNARVEPMSGDTKHVPRRTGGLTAYFVAENPSSGITESDKNWNSVQLVAKTIATLTRYSMQLSDDAIISIGDDLTSEIAYAFADKEDECGFNGDGTSTYGGIVGLKSGTADGSTVTAATGNTSFATLDLADFESMVGKLPTYAEANAKWYISKAGWAASMLRLIDAGGGNTWRDLANGRRELAFLGYPVVIVQVMNSTLTAQTSTDGLCYFGDLQQAAVLGNRRGVSVFPSEHRYMEFNQVGVRGMQRFDIAYHERGDANNAGSIIMLSTPSS